MKYWVLLLGVACTGESIIEKQSNEAPVITIQSHGSGAQFVHGMTETFRAQVSDEDHDAEDLEVAWYVGEELVCDWTNPSELGESSCDILLEVGDTSIIAEARDAEDLGGRAEISIAVSDTQAPVVLISSPTSGDIFQTDQLIQFTAIISDAEDAPGQLTSTWFSSADGLLSLDITPDASGEISDATYLSLGQHYIELRVQDSDGKLTTEAVIVEVIDGNEEPVLSSLSISPSSGVYVDTLLSCSATATDPEDGVLTPTYAWDLAGNTFQGDSLDLATTSAAIGDAVTCMATATDSGGSSTSSSTFVLVENQRPDQPTVSISPSTAYNDTVLTCSATASDAEDGALTPSYSWSIGGSSFSGATLDLATTSAMPNDLITCTATVTDSAGESSFNSDSITVDNRAPSTPSISISPTSPIVQQDDLTCSIISQSADQDGHSVSYNYYWLDPSGQIQQSTTQTTSLSDVFLASGTSSGTWTCQVEASDGIDTSSTTATVSVSSGSGPCVTTWNPNDADPDINFLDSNMTVQTSASWGGVRATTSKSSGKWYYEAELNGQQHFVMVGVGYSSFDLTQCCTGWNGSWGYYLSQQELRGNHTGSSTYLSNAAGWCGQTNCTIGVAVDVDTGEIWWSMDGVWQLTGDPASSPGAFSNISGTVYPQVSIALNYTATSVTLHTCSAEMQFTPPSGFSTWD